MNESNRISPLLQRLREEKDADIKGGIYHKTQILLTYHSNHIEGSRLTEKQTRAIFETNTIITDDQKNILVDDVMETVNHFECIKEVIDNADKPLTEDFIKKLHYLLKQNTKDSKISWFKVGGYKRLPNEVGNADTTLPEDTPDKMEELLYLYQFDQRAPMDKILDFHVRFEGIHPFQDGNGRIGRLIMFKECLQSNIVPFIIEDENKQEYYTGLQEWYRDPKILKEICILEQSKYQACMDYFRI